MIGLREDLKRRLSAVEEAVKKEKDKINRDLADHWEYLSALEKKQADRWEYLSALEKEHRALKEDLKKEGYI